MRVLSCEAQRTLIKSPLELWEELGDPAGLSRHLGSLGEITITRIEPETMVEWESEELNGTVVLAPSGFGTKVALTAVGRELSQSGATGASHEGAAGMEPEDAEAEALAAIEPEPQAPVIGGPAEMTAARPAAPEPVTTAEPAVAVTPEAPTAEPRRGFFARLFGRRARSAHSQELAVAPEPAVVARPEPAAPVEPQLNSQESAHAEATAEATPAPRARVPAPAAAEIVESEADAIEAVEPEPEPAPEPRLGIWLDEIEQAEAAEIRAKRGSRERAGRGPRLTREEVQEILTKTLDRLGAAHHRPFSRA